MNKAVGPEFRFTAPPAPREVEVDLFQAGFPGVFKFADKGAGLDTWYDLKDNAIPARAEERAPQYPMASQADLLSEAAETLAGPIVWDLSVLLFALVDRISSLESEVYGSGEETVAM